MGYDIFVSYSTQDKLFADALVNSLENSKFRCWYAPRDIPAGVTWPSAIAAAIKQTPVMLLIFSASSNSSQEVSRELTLASNNKCIAIPLRIENVLPSEELEYHLTNRHWLDVYGLELEAAVSQVMDVLDGYADVLRQNGEARASTLQAGATAPRNTPPVGLKPVQLSSPQPGAKLPLKRVVPTSLVVLLALGALFWLFNSHNAEGIQPAAEAPVYTYVGNNGLQIKTLRLENTSVREYLLQVSGLPDAPFNGRVFRAQELGGQPDVEYKFFVKIDGQSHLYFQQSYGEGVLFEPNVERSHWVSYKESSKSWLRCRPCLTTGTASRKNPNAGTSKG